MNLRGRVRNARNWSKDNTNMSWNVSLLKASTKRVIRSLQVEIEMMSIQQDSRKERIIVDLKNAKEMKELCQVGEKARK